MTAEVSQVTPVLRHKLPFSLKAAEHSSKQWSRQERLYCSANWTDKGQVARVLDQVSEDTIQSIKGMKLAQH